MNKIAPKQAAILLGVLAVVASIINGTQKSKSQVRSEQGFVEHPISQPPQQPVEKREATARPIQTVEARRDAEPSIRKTIRDITPEIDYDVAARRAAEEAAQRAQYLARYVNGGIARKPGTATVALAVASDELKINRAVAAALLPHFKTNTVEILSSFFKPAFVSDRLFADVFKGSTEVLQKLELSKSLDAVLLARQEVRYTTDPALDNLITANMVLEVVLLPVLENAESQTWTFTANGAGFRQGDARQMAEERLIKQIAKDTNMTSSQVLPTKQ